MLGACLLILPHAVREISAVGVRQEQPKGDGSVLSQDLRLTCWASKKYCIVHVVHVVVEHLPRSHLDAFMPMVGRE